MRKALLASSLTIRLLKEARYQIKISPEYIPTTAVGLYFSPEMRIAQNPNNASGCRPDWSNSRLKQDETMSFINNAVY